MAHANKKKKISVVDCMGGCVHEGTSTVDTDHDERLGAATSTQERFLRDDSKTFCNRIKDRSFRTGLETVLEDLELEPICLGTNINQKDSTRLDQVLLTIYLRFANIPRNRDTRGGMPDGRVGGHIMRTRRENPSMHQSWPMFYDVLSSLVLGAGGRTQVYAPVMATVLSSMMYYLHCSGLPHKHLQRLRNLKATVLIVCRSI
ncbi:hypothetical protein C8J57DRAFT_1643876 [Mycena rebaudengoi]|nr:hypothetical protein C8J57DRAFT_1643876 [Mycena rebaudengoi]